MHIHPPFALFFSHQDECRISFHEIRALKTPFHVLSAGLIPVLQSCFLDVLITGALATSHETIHPVVISSLPLNAIP